MEKIFFDFGNTAWKCHLLAAHSAPKLIRGQGNKEVEDLLTEYMGQNTKVAYCAVNHSMVPAMLLQSHVQKVHTQMSIPNITSEYKSQSTLGIDRWCNVAGASRLASGPTFLVVDIGTCIKYELVIQSKYKGGAISPGMSMRFKSLYQGTELLPHLEGKEKIESVGTDSDGAMQAGVQFGMLSEIRGWVDKMETDFGPMPMFITGGDVFKFEKDLKNSFFAVPELTLIGIDVLLEN
jgi:pantothenate kinase type III